MSEGGTLLLLLFEAVAGLSDTFEYVLGRPTGSSVAAGGESRTARGEEVVVKVGAGQLRGEEARGTVHWEDFCQIWL